MSFVIEGTLSEVQERLHTLPVAPQDYLRVTVDKAEPSELSREQFLAVAERKNGLIMSRLEYQGKPLAVEVVEELQEDEL